MRWFAGVMVVWCNKRSDVINVVANTLEVDMHKVLQALVDTIQLAAGSVELGSAAYSPNYSSRDLHRRAAAKPLRVPSEEPQPFVREPAFRTSAEKSQF